MQWLEWLDKRKYSGLTPRQQEIKDSIDSETHEDPFAKEVSMNEEVPLEKLTHGKLEEVEKLKSWQIFLKGFGGVEGDVDVDETPDKPITQKKLKNPTKIRMGTLGGKEDERPATPKTGEVKTPQYGRQMSRRLGDVSPKHAEESSKLAFSRQFGRELGSSGSALGSKGSPRIKPNKTQEELDQEFFTKSWERWLIKETNEDKILGTQLNEARAVNTGKVPESKIKPKIDEEAKQGEITSFNAEKWKSWLSKMQGAGDARFGNQHLTGLEIEPIADDQSLEITTDGEKKHDKPYKESSKKENEYHGRLK